MDAAELYSPGPPIESTDLASCIGAGTVEDIRSLRIFMVRPRLLENKIRHTMLFFQALTSGSFLKMQPVASQ